MSDPFSEPVSFGRNALGARVQRRAFVAALLISGANGSVVGVRFSNAASVS